MPEKQKTRNKKPAQMWNTNVTNSGPPMLNQLIDLFTETTKTRMQLRLEIACMTDCSLFSTDSRNFPYANLSFAPT